MSCNICCDTYNISSRAKIICSYCDFDACRMCCETYVLSEPLPKCLNSKCNKEWSRKFIREKFTNSFVNNKFKKHMENILFEQEKALMPATQPIIEEKNRKRRIRKEMEEIDDQIEELLKQKRQLERTIYNPLLDKSTETQKSSFMRSCAAEGCRGFLSSQWKCGVCEQWTCPDCHELKGANRDDPDHKCDPNNVETAKLLSKDTKPCPKCQTKIFKIDGCFAENTPILLWNGELKMSQNITIGDELIGDDGNKRIVEDICKGQDKLYEIQQSNGITYIVNSKHTLVLKMCGKNEVIHMTIDDYMKLTQTKKNNLYGFKSNNGVNYEKQEVLLDPYMLGLWLGDGTSVSPTIASNDNEIKEYINNWCLSNDAELVQESKYKLRIRRKGYSFGKESISTETYKNIPNVCDRTNPFTNLLKKYNLVGNKHIPNEYLFNDRETRLKLLAGIIDTDGHVTKESKGKRVCIIQTGKQFSEQIIYLAKSLGFLVNYQIREKKNCVIFNCEPKDYKDQYVINISGENLEEIPTILPRKKCVNSNPNKDYFKMSISVKELEIGNYYGWIVNDNHRFILSDFTVVKNCDQMWCTQCHTAFSWKTGALSTSIHNPHYFEWMRTQGGGRQPRAAGDIICGQELSHNTPDQIETLIYARNQNRNPECKNHKNLCTSIEPKKYYYPRNTTNLGENIYPGEFDVRYKQEVRRFEDQIRQVLHIRHVEMPRFRVDHFEKNQELRVRYLCNEIDEDELKIQIQRNDKKNRKQTEILNVLRLLETTITDIAYRVMDDLKNSPTNEHHFNEIVKEVDILIEYCNNLLKDVSFTYNCVCYHLDENLHLGTIKRETKPKKASKKASASAENDDSDDSYDE